MLRYSNLAHTRIENPKINAFLHDVIRVCENHGLSLSHEDKHGAFEVVKFSTDNNNWLFEAIDGTDFCLKTQ